MSNIKKMCYDKILPGKIRRAILFESIGRGRTRAISPIGKLWPNGSTLRISFMGGTNSQRNNVQQWASEWTKHANLKFNFGNDPDADIRIAFLDDGSWSYIGTDAKGIPLFRSTMNFGWLDEAVVLHEFGHTIGLAHEHSNPESGIQWNENAVVRDLSGPPNNWDLETIRHNVLNKYRHDQINGTEFDSKSIMLYSFPAEWTTDGFHSEPTMKLSATDKRFVTSQKMYPGNTPPENAEVELQVRETKATEASIGQPGEEDLYRFTASTPGRYTVETVGETDVFMKLYGPDNRLQLIAEDDDSGQGYNPRINADLLPGQYFIQIRHYNRTGGTGSYGIKVTK